MASNPSIQGHLPSSDDMVSEKKQVEPITEIPKEDQSSQIKQEGNINPQSQTTKVSTGPTVVKITKKIVTTTQPATQTQITRKVITTNTRGVPSNATNNRYNNTGSSYNQRVPQTKTTTSTNSNYIKPTVKSTMTNNRGGNNNTKPNINMRNIDNNVINQPYKNVNPNNKPSRVQNSQSYSGNRNQPKRPEVIPYKPRAVSPGPGTIKRKTINRGKPVENVQITHIIYSSRPLEFHITEDLNMDNINNNKVIQISEEERNNLQKTGKVETSCSCDKVEIKKIPPPNLEGKMTHYQHAQGIGMTDDKSQNINPKFYFSEIKKLEPLLFNKGEPNSEILTFRSDGKNYNTTRTVTKTQTKPVNSSYSNNKSMNNYSQSRTYNNTSQIKNPNVNNRGMVSTVKTTTTNTNNNLRGSAGIGNSGKIVKETTTKVQMGSRSQFQNQSKPVVKTTTERKVYNQNNFFKK